MKKILFLLLAALFAMQGWSQTTPGTIPWVCNFEDPTENAQWTFDNGSCTNKWVIGTAVSSDAITGSSLYISNDDGVNNAYTVNGTGAYNVVIATRTIESSGADSYLLSFDWKCAGESNWDFFRVFLVDESNTSFVASNSSTAAGYTTTFASRNFAAGSIAGVVTTNTLSPTNANILNGYISGTTYNTTTHHVEAVLPSMGASGTVKKLIIVWRNDNTSGYQPSAALDNFSINVIACPALEALAVPTETITTDNAVVNWTAIAQAQEYVIQWKPSSVSSWDNPVVASGNTTNTFFNMQNLTAATQYNVRVRAVCNIGVDSSTWITTDFSSDCVPFALPYVQNFDANKNIPVCWTTFGSVAVIELYPTSSPNTLRFSGGTNIAVLPVFEADVNTARISFVLRRESMSYSGTMDIGYLTDISDANSFVAVMTNILTVQAAITPFDTALSAFPAGIKNIAFKQTTTSSIYYYHLDNVFVYDPNCVPVNAFAAQNITATSVDITWSDNNSPSTSWNVELYSTAQSDPVVGGGNILTATVSDTGVNITNLTPSTTYFLYVKNDCGWSSHSFTMPCIATSIPYIQNFDVNTNIPNCWITFGSVGISTTYPTSSPNTLRFNGAGTNIAVLPVLDVDVNTTKLYFVMQRESMTYSGAMEIGYLTSIWNANSFVPVLTDILTVEDINTPFETDLSAFPAGIKNIAFRQIATSGYYYWLDNVAVYSLNCLPVNTFAAQNITATSADITWSDDHSPSTSWNVEIYSAPQLNPTIGGGVISTTVTGTLLNLTNLNPNTFYYIYVKNDCEWSSYSFQTHCEAITTLPFKETFETNSTSRDCWRIINANNDGDAWIFYSGSSYAHGGTYSAQIYTNYNNGNNNDWLISPAITLSNAALLKYWYRARSSSEPDAFEVLLSTTGNQPADFTYTLLPSTEFNNTTYQQTILDLSAYVDSTIYIAWHVPQGGPDGYYIYVDDIEVINCEVPYNIHVPVETLTETSADILWSGMSPSNTWNIAIYANATTTPTVGGGDIANGTVTTKSFSAASLTTASTYYVYIQSVCDTTWSSYTFTTLAACPTPTGLTLASVNAAAGEATLSWDALTATGWNIKVSSTVLTDPENETANIENEGTATGTPQFLVTGLTIGTYYYYIQSDCGSAWANGTIVLQYCTPDPASVDEPGGIHHVTFGILPMVDHATAPPAEAPFYNDNSNLIGGIIEGETTFPISVTQGYSYGYITKIWVDWNNDLTFDNVTELVAGPSADVGGVQNLTATIPANTPVGSYRLRIGSHDGPSFGALIPCYSGLYGSYEDYTLKIVPVPSCLYVTNLAVNDITSSSATATWTAPATAPTNGYQVLVSTSATEPTGTENEIQAITGTLLNIDNLVPQSSYYVWVRSDCGNEEYSSWMSVNFITSCVAHTFPYDQNFDANTNMPFCWNTFGLVQILTDHPTSQPNALQFSGNGTNIAVLPVFDVDVNTARISFVLRRESMIFSGSMDIGYLTNMLDANSFVAVMTDILTAQAVSTPFDTALSAFPAGIKNIAFRQSVAPMNYFYWLDDINVYPAPIISCPSPALNAPTLTHNTATIIWIAGGAETQWQVAWKEDAASDWNNPVEVAATTYNMSGLTATTDYNVRVRAICGEGDTSTWTVRNFTTPATCPTPTGLLANINAVTGEATLSWDALGATGWNIKVSSTVLTDPENETADIENEGTATETPQFLVTGLTIGSTYYYYIQSDCGGAWANGTIVLQYCTPDPASVDNGGGILHVTFGILPMVDHATVPPSVAPYYNDNSDLIGGVIEGDTTFPISVTQGAYLGYITKIWVDWNNDFTFDNVTELVAGPSADMQGVQNLTATIPANTPVGSYRLRIGSHDDPEFGALIPCYVGLWGSYEDYTLEIVPVPPCLYPTNLAINDITPSSATATWTAPATAPTNGYQVFVSTSATEPTGTEDEIQVVTDTFLVIDNLDPLSSYYVWVRSDCGNEAYSAWMSVNFTTLCSTITIPYIQKFDANTNIPSCWNTFGSFTVVPGVNYSTSQPNTLRFNGAGTNIAVLPVFDADVNTAKISFVLRRENPYMASNSGPMDLGYLTDITDSNSFVAVMTDILTVTNVNTPFDTALSAFPAGITNIAFRQTTTASYWYWLDNVFVYDPNCVPVNAFATQNITATSADITWSDNNSPSTSWNVEVYSTAIENPTVGGGDVSTTTVLNTEVNITGLTPVTTYYLYVKNDCGWSDYSFTTPCMAMSIPYEQNFDANTNMPSCWSKFGSVSVVETLYSTSLPNTLRFNGSTTNTVNIAVLPIFDVDVNTAKISFVLRREDSARSGPMDIGYLTNIWDANSFVAVMTDILTVLGVNTPFDTALSAFPAGIKNIAFRQTPTNNYWYWLDNIHVYDPNCVPVNAFAAQNITATSADITWSDNNSPSTSWNVELYSTAQENPTVGGGDVVTTTALNTEVNITNLTPATTYYLYVKNDCGWSNYSFTMPCMATSIPYEQNFDANTNWPSCWSKFGSATIAVGGFPTSEPHTLRFSGNGTNIVVLPTFDVDVNTAKISFVLRREDMASSGPMDIGYLTNIWDANSFVAVMTDILTVEDVNTPFDTALSAFPAGITNIAFRQTTTADYWYWLDNIYVYDPNCLPVNAFAAQNITTTSADITWSDNDSPSTSWNVELYSTAQENPTVGGGDVFTTTALNTEVNITNLTPGTTYYLYVKNDCGWSDYSFTTECVLVTLPYTQNFDLNIDLPNCWTMFGHFIVKDSYATSEPNTLRFEGGGINIAALPVFDVDVNTARLAFVLRKEHISNSGAMDIGYLTNMSDESSFVAVMTNILIAANANTSFDTALSVFPAGITNIAFRQTAAFAYFYWLDNVDVYAAPITCSAPTALNHTTLTHNAATITWTAGNAETEWQVAWKEAVASDWSNPVEVTATTYDISGLIAATDYNVRVRAICGEGNASAWTTHDFTTLAAPLCLAPTEVAATATFDAATITWTAGDAETEWQVTWKEVVASDWNNIAEATAIPYGISGLAASTEYEVKVRAICGASDTSDWSDAITFTTLTCLDPTNIAATAVTANSITITWQPMNGETDWKVSWKNVATGDLGSGDAHNNDNEGYTIIDLVANTEYQICVTAVCAEGVESDPTNCINASTDGSGIHDITLANSLQLYPNPTTGELRIKNYELREGDNIEIYNVLGQKQQLTTNNYPLTTIDVSHLSAGIYTVKIGGYVGKFVKK